MKQKYWQLKKPRNKWYPEKTMTDTDYADDLVLLTNTSAQAKSQLHNLEQAARDIGVYVNTNKTNSCIWNKTQTSQH